MIFKFLQILLCMAAIILFLSGCTDSSLSRTNLQTKNESSSLGDEASPASANDADSSNTQQVNVPQPDTNSDTEENMVKKMTLQIGNSSFTATLENNPAVDAFVEMMNDSSVIIQMNDYSGFEKVGSLGTNLPADDKQTTTHAGDIVLYNGNQIVIFYGSNSWSYTRLGKIDDLSGWEDALGSGDITVTFSLGTVNQ
ncbi:MAG: cyclophilin-like fold protein [Lachnospiraceae bacterium]|nr:cyclophilin-like fold protein [Lachnospiraceae bacterium]